MADAEAAPKKKGGKGLIMIIALVVVLAGGGGAAWFFMGSGGGSGGSHGADAGGNGEDAGGHGADAGGHGGDTADSGGGHGEDAGGHGGESGGVDSMLSLQALVTNLADPEGDRFVKCTLKLVLDSQEAAAKVKGDSLALTRIRDKVLTVVSAKTASEVTSAQGKEHLREEIREQLEPILHGAKISEVYYTEFLVQ